MEKKLLSIGEAAKTLGISIDTLRRWDKNGVIKSIRGSKIGHRYYLKSDLYMLINDLFKVAEQWVTAEHGAELNHDLYCPTSDVFQSRLIRMQNELIKTEDLSTPFSLIVAVTAEICNNSFDHNLGNWRDLPGVFFGYDIKKRHIVLADRGQGILKTLRRVKPELKNDSEAIETGFTEIITGRAPEERGNGLKFVKKIVTTNPMNLLFESGDSKLILKNGDTNLSIEVQDSYVYGCIAMIQF